MGHAIRYLFRASRSVRIQKLDENRESRDGLTDIQCGRVTKVCDNLARIVR